MYFKFKNIIIDENEIKSLAELGFVNNSKLTLSLIPFETNLQTK